MLIPCPPVHPTALQAGLVGYVEEEGGKLWRDAASERTRARRKGREVVSERSGRMTDEPSTIICHSEFSRSGPGRERLQRGDSGELALDLAHVRFHSGPRGGGRRPGLSCCYSAL